MVRDTADTAVVTPHSLTVDNQRRVWVAHSGAAADKVSIIDIDPDGLGAVDEVTAGTNPFGLAFIP